MYDADTMDHLYEYAYCCDPDVEIQWELLRAEGGLAEVVAEPVPAPRLVLTAGELAWVERFTEALEALGSGRKEQAVEGGLLAA